MSHALAIQPFPIGMPDGYALLARLHHAAFSVQGDRGWGADDFRQLVESPGVQVLVASRDDAAFGFILVRAVCDEAELITIAVDPGSQRGGCGHALLEAATHRLRQAGVVRFFLEVRKDNIAAIQLYEKFGFTRVGLRKGYYQTHSGNRVDALCLALFLSEQTSLK